VIDVDVHVRDYESDPVALLRLDETSQREYINERDGDGRP
jgi:hypothetical protein